MRNFRRVLSLVLATMLCLSFSTVAFAAEVNTPAAEATVSEEQLPEVFVVSANGEVRQVQSSIDGYAEGTLRSDSTGLVVCCTASGIGGMGITVETQCSQTYDVTLVGFAQGDSLYTTELTEPITTNGHYEFHNLHHSGDFSHYIIGLSGIPDGVEVQFKVWIYG